MAVIALKGRVGSFVGAPLMRTGNPARSAPVAWSSECMYQWGSCGVAPSFVFASRKTLLVAASKTGVEVMPMLGVRSPQLTVDAGQAGPRERCHFVAPVTLSSP